MRHHIAQATYPNPKRATLTDSYLVLLQSGVYTAAFVTKYAVGSYPTFSSLPNSWRYIFCCTFRRLAPPRSYLALCSVKSGLSSNIVLAVIQPTLVYFNIIFCYLEISIKNLYIFCFGELVIFAISLEASVGER